MSGHSNGPSGQHPIWRKVPCTPCGGQKRPGLPSPCGHCLLPQGLSEPGVTLCATAIDRLFDWQAWETVKKLCLHCAQQPGLWEANL